MFQESLRLTRTHSIYRTEVSGVLRSVDVNERLSLAKPLLPSRPFTLHHSSIGSNDNAALNRSRNT